MSHREQREFVQSVKQRHPRFFKDTSVLDVGSLDVNGSNRVFFSGGRYLGIDLVAGKGVDRVCAIEAVDGEFDVVISTECLEHDPGWKTTFERMIERTRIGGLVVMTCAGPGRLEHGTRARPMPGMGNDTDYYGNLSPRQILDVATEYPWEEIGCWFDGRNKDTYFWGITA